jgi:hypothetical protein
MANQKQKTDNEDSAKIGAFLGYFFRKKDLDRPVNFNLKVMHGINKVSMLMFLIGLIYLISKYIF